MHSFVMNLDAIDSSMRERAGGKGASLGELRRIAGIRVPAGICVATTAFDRVTASLPEYEQKLKALADTRADDVDAVRALSAALRAQIASAPIPDDLAEEIRQALVQLGEHGEYAVRSSATAEDTPTASFAGQQDSYLNVRGPADVMKHVSRCWASLYTERALSYRIRNGVDHRSVSMAVIIQEMVAARASGVLFTADPMSGNRKMAVVESVHGLGNAAIAGEASADRFVVREDLVDTRSVVSESPSLSDDEVVRLVRLGRIIEKHFGQPQDIEWCLADDHVFAFVQSRPITTLFPVPPASDDQNRVYLSVGHQQMMTDAMRPLGLSMWQHSTMRPMSEAGSRLWVEVTATLASAPARGSLMELLGKSDPQFENALRSLIDRGDFIATVPSSQAVTPPVLRPVSRPVPTDASIPAALIERNQASVDKLRRDIANMSGSELIDFIIADTAELKRLLFDAQSHAVIMAGMEAAWWLNAHLLEWLGEANAVNVLSQSVPHNITSEMGLDLLDVADVVRAYPDVVAFLRTSSSASLLDQLTTIAGGVEAREAIQRWLDRYGMRAVGEIDTTRPRWSEQPAMLLPLLLAHIDDFTPGEAKRRFARGVRAAKEKEEELLARLRALPDGEQKANETKQMIDRLRTFAGYREYPKYGKINREFVYKQALLREARRLVAAGVLREAEDIYFLRLEELPQVVRSGRVDEQLIRERKEAFAWHQSLKPPRVLTSDGEGLSGSYARNDVPEGALTGLAVSAGVVEGRARVVLDIAGARLEPGDILVTKFTDPSWTPLFVSASALVTEIGGLMTHGAVIAREYGLPAVVGVERATELIADGQRIRVHGAEGYVELLP